MYLWLILFSCNRYNLAIWQQCRGRCVPQRFHQTFDLHQADGGKTVSSAGRFCFSLLLSETGHIFVYLRAIYFSFPVSYHLLLGYWTLFLLIFIGTIYLTEELGLCIQELQMFLPFILRETQTKLCVW